jgi:hypothetical protein
MATRIPITFFAPAKREPIKVVHRQARRLGRTPLTRSLLNASLNYLFLLNARRQIVMASENVLELVPGKTIDEIVGLRPGEALGCIHAYECESGCGTSEICHLCAAVKGDVVLRPGERALIPTGFRLAIPAGYEGLPSVTRIMV